jgi:hypothetical protein
MPKLLFYCNGVPYYGDSDLVYSSMILFKDIKDNCNFAEPIILHGNVPEYIMNLYIHAIYTNNFDLNDVKTNDIVTFIKFIDQYPTINLSVDKLEQQLISYKLDYDNVLNELLDIFTKYFLKYIYLDIHNHKIQKMGVI